MQAFARVCSPTARTDFCSKNPHTCRTISIFGPVQQGELPRRGKRRPPGGRPSKKRIALYFVANATKLLRRASQTSHLYLKAENIFFDSPTAGHLPCRFHFFLASSRRFVYNIPRLGRVLPSRRPFTSVFVCLSGVARRRCNTQEARVA